MGSMISLKAADGATVTAYQAAPLQGPVKGGIVVLQEIFGVNAHIRAVTDGFAAQGYLAIAPGLFDRMRPGADLGYTATDVNLGASFKAVIEELPAPGVMQDIAAAIAAVAGAGKVGVIGYCWGGKLAWRAACELPGVGAAVSYYGGGMTAEPELSKKPNCPVLAHFGETDHVIPMPGVEAFKAAHPEVEVHVYPAGHGFNCDQRPSYDEAAANTARERTLAFFARHLA